MRDTCDSFLESSNEESHSDLPHTLWFLFLVGRGMARRPWVGNDLDLIERDAEEKEGEEEEAVILAAAASSRSRRQRIDRSIDSTHSAQLEG